jgi:hypothetical protein
MAFEVCYGERLQMTVDVDGENPNCLLNVLDFGGTVP